MNRDKDFSPQSSETAEGNATENCNARESSGHDDTVDSRFDRKTKNYEYLFKCSLSNY
jgi:hypothetical protein